MKIFIVDSKDLFDEKKNPGLVLSPSKILKNRRVPKIFLKEKRRILKKCIDCKNHNKCLIEEEHKKDEGCFWYEEKNWYE